MAQLQSTTITGGLRMTGHSAGYMKLNASGDVVMDTSTLATQEYVSTQITNLINGAPGALDTLNELAAALGNDASFATSVTNSLATKLALAGGTMTGALNIDYANAYLYIKSANSGSGIQWHDQIWLGRYDRVQTASQYPNYLPGAAYGLHITQSSDALFFGLISRGANSNDYNAVIAWGDDAGDILQFRFNNGVVASLTDAGTFNATNITLNSAQVATQSWVTSQGYITGSYLPLSGGTMSGVITTVSSGTAINFSGQSDSFGYNSISGLGTYIKGTGSTYIYGGGSFYDGSAQRAILHAGNYNSYSPTLTGGNASGTWGISITGNAATATTASNSSTLNGISVTQIFNNMGNGHGTYTNFNSVGDFGVRYIQGTTNGPNTGASQYYGFTLGLGSQYPLDGAGSYASQFYWGRTSEGGSPYVSVRFKENNSWGTWGKIWAGYADTAGALSSMNISQFTNNSGYLTAESDTLATVTGRGASTTAQMQQNSGRYVRDSSYRTISGSSDYYGGGSAGWYKVAQITLTGNCSGAVLFGTLNDNRYDGADAYQISVVARAECDFTSNNESHYINVGASILGSTNYTNYRDKVRVLLVASSSGSRTYELQFYETPWNHDTWELQTTGWTIYSSPQAPGSSTGTARVNYISKQNSDYYYSNVAMYVNNNTVWHAGNDGSGSGLDADLLDGLNSSTSSTANTIVARDSGGDIYGRYVFAVHFNASCPNNENPSIAAIWTNSGSDNYLRKSTPAHFTSQLGLATQSWVTSQGYITGSYLPLSGGTLSGNLNIQTGNNPAHFLLRGTNPEMYIDAGYGGGTARLLINRAGTGNQATLFFTTGATVTPGTAWNSTGNPIWSMGMTNSSQVNDFKIAYGDIYDGGSVAVRIDTNKIVYFTNTPYVGGNIMATQSWVTSQGYLTSGSFLPLSGGTMSGKIFTVSTGTGTYDTAIEIRETGYAGTGQSAWGYSPAMTFHWGGRYAKRFGMRSDGLFAVDGDPIVIQNGGTWGINITGNAATVGSRSVGNSAGNIAYYDSNGNLYVNNPESYSGEVRLGAAWGRGGVYASSTLSLSTSASQIHFVFGNGVPIYVNSSGSIIGDGVVDLDGKSHYLGVSNNWDGVGFGSLTNLHFQGHNQFWVGAGNAYWYRGGISTEHDLLISTMQGYDSTSYYRGITFAVDVNGNGNNGGYRLGRWQTHNTDWKTARLQVDASLAVGYGARGTRAYDTSSYPLDRGVWQHGRDATGYGVDRWRDYLFSPTSNGGGPWGSFASLEVSSIYEGNSDIPALFRMHQWGSGAAEFWKPQGTVLYLRESPGGGGSWFTRFEVQGSLTSNNLLFPNGFQITQGGSNYGVFNSWVRLDGHYGFYSGTNGSHIYPNNGSYGSWRIEGSRNGWGGFEFSNGSAGNVSLMLASDSNTSGFHNNSYGWQIRWANGTLYIGKNSYGGNEATVIDSSSIGSQSVNYASSSGTASNANALGGLGSGAYMKDDGWNSYPGQDANTQAGMCSDFSYSNNAPWTGDLIRFGSGGYSLQLSSQYQGTGLSFRSRNGDNGTWNSWSTVIHSNNIGSQKVDGAFKLWATSHPNDYYIVNNWTGSYWQLTSNHGSGVQVAYANDSGYASSAGNSSTVGGVAIGNIVRKDVTGQYLRAYYEYGSYLTSESPIDLVNQGLAGGGLRVDFMHPSYTGSGGWNHVMTWSGYNGYNMYQLGGHYDGGTGTNLWVRSEANHGRTSWTAWRRLLNTSSDPYAANMNQYVRTSDGVTFSGLTINGTTTLNGDVNIDRHIDADTTWGNCGCTSLFLGWSTGKIIIGNNGTGAHDWANDRGANSIVSTVNHFFYNNIYAREDVIAYWSDARLKDNVRPIEGALEKITKIGGYYYTPSKLAVDLNATSDMSERVGVMAQEIEEVLPHVVKPAPFNSDYKTVQYEKLVPLLIEAIKEQQTQIEELKSKLDGLTK